MFHLVLIACLAEEPDICRRAVLPAGEAEDQQTCLQKADAIRTDWLSKHAELTADAAECVETATLDALDARGIAPGVYFHQGADGQIAADNLGRIANLSFIVGDTVAVIDAGGSRAEGEALYAAIRQVTDKPISHLILTHMHPDHSLGAEVFKEAGAKIVGHAKLQQSLEMRAASYLDNLDRIVGNPEMIGTSVVQPDTAAKDGMEIDLGTTVLTLLPGPTAHTDNDLAVRDSASDTLFAGDLIFRDLMPVVDGSLNGWLGWMETPPEPPPALIVPGHGPAAKTWTEAAEAQQKFLTALRDATRAAIDDGLSMSEAVPAITEKLRPFADTWSAFDEDAPRDATTSYKELEWE